MQNVIHPINLVSIFSFQTNFHSINIQFCIQHNVEHLHVSLYATMQAEA
jgi:hypothetical protein